jgi:hypothetical protein
VPRHEFQAVVFPRSAATAFLGAVFFASRRISHYHRLTKSFLAIGKKRLSAQARTGTGMTAVGAPTNVYRQAGDAAVASGKIAA